MSSGTTLTLKNRPCDPRCLLPPPVAAATAASPAEWDTLWWFELYRQYQICNKNSCVAVIVIGCYRWVRYFNYWIVIIVICGFFFGLPVWKRHVTVLSWDAHWCPLFTPEMRPWGCLPLVLLPAEFAVGSASQPGAEGVAVDVPPPGGCWAEEGRRKPNLGPLRGQCQGGKWWKLPFSWGEMATPKLLLTDSCRCHHYMVSSREMILLGALKNPLKSKLWSNFDWWPGFKMEDVENTWTYVKIW